MFYRQCFLISAAGIYGSLWTISTGSARHNWEKQVCCTDSWMCCSGLLCWKILEVDNVLKLVFTPCTGKICPITYCNYNLQSSIKLLKKIVLVSFIQNIPVLWARSLPFPMPHFPFWRNKIFCWSTGRFWKRQFIFTKCTEQENDLLGEISHCSN